MFALVIIMQSVESTLQLKVFALVINAMYGEHSARAISMKTSA
jgi:hypothetical protein